MEHISLNNMRWLLAALTLTLALHAGHLAPWLILLAIMFGAWRYLIAARQLKLPPSWILLPIMVAGIAGLIATYQGLFTRNGSVALLSLMLAMKTLETRNRRDVMLMVFFGYFLTITAFLFSQSLLFGVFATLPTVALTITLIGINHPNGDLSWRFKGKLAGTMLGQAFPVMLVLFLLFPRVNGPLWGVTQDTSSGIVGLSDSMAPGSISQVALSDAVAFRAEFKGKQPDPSALYWRGLILWYYDGRSWREGNASRTLPQETLQGNSMPVAYNITLEPHNRHWMFLLDMPALAPSGAETSHDYQTLSHEPVRQRIRYDGASYLHYTLDTTLDQHAHALALQLPDDGNPQTRALAESWKKSGASPQILVQRALDFFHEKPFVYTITPPLLGENAVDDFLFGSRRGFCEHYAGSFVFLMRAAGIPARVVTGYQGGELNHSGNYFLIRQSDAHAWAEVWLEGQGWVRIDPTAAVSPQRVEAGGVAAALPANEPLPILSRHEFTLLSQLYLQWDYANYAWNQWVIGYNQKRQAEFLSRLAGSPVSWQDMAYGLIILVGTVMLVISLVMLRGGRKRVDPAQRLYLKLLRKLARRGIVHSPHEGALDLAQRAASMMPVQAELIKQICHLYTELRYGAGLQQKDSAQLLLLRQLVNQL